MRLKPFSAFMTRRGLTMLRMRAASADTFRTFAAESAFKSVDLRVEGILMDARLTR